MLIWDGWALVDGTDVAQVLHCAIQIKSSYWNELHIQVSLNTSADVWLESLMKNMESPLNIDPWVLDLCLGKTLFY